MSAGLHPEGFIRLLAAVALLGGAAHLVGEEPLSLEHAAEPRDRVEP